MVALSVPQPGQALGRGFSAGLKISAGIQDAKARKLRNQMLERELAHAGEKDALAAALSTARAGALNASAARSQMLTELVEESKGIDRQIKEARLAAAQSGTEAKDLSTFIERQDFINQRMADLNRTDLSPDEALEYAGQFPAVLNADPKVRDKTQAMVAEQIMRGFEESKNTSQDEFRKNTIFMTGLMQRVINNPGSAKLLGDIYRNDPDVLAAIDAAEKAGELGRTRDLGSRAEGFVRFETIRERDILRNIEILKGEVATAERILNAADKSDKPGRRQEFNAKVTELEEAEATERGIRRSIGRFFPAELKDEEQRRESLDTGVNVRTAAPAEKAKAPGAKDRIAGSEFTKLLGVNKARDRQGRVFPFAATVADAKRMIASGEIKPGQSYITGKGERLVAPERAAPVIPTEVPGRNRRRGGRGRGPRTLPGSRATRRP